MMSDLRDVEILCDVHLVPMRLTSDYVHVQPTDIFPSDLRKCMDISCTRRFSELQGYVDVIENRIDGVNRKLKYCPEGHRGMAIVRVVNGVPEWKCLHRGCECSK